MTAEMQIFCTLIFGIALVIGYERVEHWLAQRKVRRICEDVAKVFDEMGRHEDAEEIRRLSK